MSLTTTTLPSRQARQLLAWQAEALARWDSAGRRGIVEAVTGSGKTHVALGAIERLYAENKCLSTLIVVPTIALMDQWYDRLTAYFPGKRVGRIGGNHKDDFSIICIACVAVINSAASKVGTLLKHCESPRNKSFLIADECHRYIEGPFFSRILRHRFDHTLGLSATIFDYEVPGLGRIVSQYTFRDACKDGVVPPFHLVNVAVPLTKSERDEYLRLSEKIRDQLHKVQDLFDSELEHIPDGRLFQRLRQMMALPDGGECPIIKKLFTLLFRRAKVYYLAENKQRLTERLTRLLVEQGRKKTLVFFERILSADTMEEDLARTAARGLCDRLLREEPIWCRVYHS
jgi:superfamily II DNA or RNA helicase